MTSSPACALMTLGFMLDAPLAATAVTMFAIGQLTHVRVARFCILICR
jgi:hypothetical protein